MHEIYLARHGQDQDNVDGILNGHRDQPLTELGISQAQKLAAHIKDTGLVFDHVYASPLQRAYRTAEIITETLGLPKPIREPDLIERDFGIMTGKPVGKIMEICAPDVLVTNKIKYFLSPEGAETFPQLIERAKNILDKLEAQPEDSVKILLVTHGDFGQMIYAAYYNLDWREVLALFHFNNSDLLLLSPGSQANKTHVFRTEVIP